MDSSAPTIERAAADILERHGEADFGESTNWGHVTIISAGWALWAALWIAAYCVFLAPG
jgi:hypothetical protein